MKKLRKIVISMLMVFLISSCSSEDMLNRKSDNINSKDGNTIHAFSDLEIDYTHKKQKANLYYQFQNTDLLAAEYRDVDVRSGEIPEYAIIKELLRGPKLYAGELVNPFANDIEIINAVPIYDNKILAITLSESFAMIDKTYTNAEQEIKERRLMLNAIVLSITDNFAYEGIQIFIKPNDENKEAYRLDNRFLLQDNTLPMLPILRSDDCIANHINICNTVLSSWQRNDIDTIRLFLSEDISNEKIDKLISSKNISGFKTYSGNIYNNGTEATIAVKLEIANSIEYIVYPVKMIKNSSVWKIDYDNFIKMLDSIGE